MRAQCGWSHQVIVIAHASLTALALLGRLKLPAALVAFLFSASSVLVQTFKSRRSRRSRSSPILLASITQFFLVDGNTLSGQSRPIALQNGVASRRDRPSKAYGRE